MKARVQVSPSVRARAAGDPNAPQVASILRDARVEVLERGERYTRVQLEAHVATWALSFDPILPEASDFKLGINALQNTGPAMDEAARGCEYFLIMDDFGGAHNIKRAHPGAIVMARRYFPQRFFLTPEQVMTGLEGATFPGLVYTGFNEADQGGQDGEALRTRARIDVEVARRIKARHGANYGVGKTFYAAGTFSMGTPDFTNPETCRIIREEYAPHYNAGLLGLDIHLYSPNPQHIDKPNEWQWFERRWEFLFTKCGFDPSVRAIYCGETGLDQGGVGGFPAHGTRAEDFNAWCRKFIALQSQPMVINGASYPSPILGGAIFQLGGNGDMRWEGYNIKGYLSELRKFYTGRPATRAARIAIAVRSTLRAAKRGELRLREWM